MPLLHRKAKYNNKNNKGLEVCTVTVLGSLFFISSEKLHLFWGILQQNESNAALTSAHATHSAASWELHHTAIHITNKQTFKYMVTACKKT